VVRDERYGEQRGRYSHVPARGRRDLVDDVAKLFRGVVKSDVPFLTDGGQSE
jgi:hypothetical protein